MGVPDFIPGYRIDREDVDALKAGSVAAPAFRSAPTRPISHRKWLKVRNQWRMGSCTGFAKTSCISILNYIDTLNSAGQAEIVQLSAMFAYLRNQFHCGLLGSDQGATISGSLTASLQDGDCLESTFPYPTGYTTRIPAAAFTEARDHRLLRYLRPKRYEDVWAWHQTGLGCTLIGVPWTKAMANSRGVWRRDDVRGPSMGGHALCLTGGHSEVVEDRHGRPFLEGINSHGIDFGDGGFFYVEPECLDYWIDSSSSEVICLTDVMEGFEPRMASPDWSAVWRSELGLSAPNPDFTEAWQ